MGATTRILLQAGKETVRHWLPVYRWIPVVGGFGAFALSFAAGANDLPISYATSVGAGTLTMLQAIIVASAMEFTGAASVGNLKTDARYLNLWRETPPDAGLLMWGFFVVIIAATTWLIIATYFELPVSSFSSIQGAILGVGLIAQSVDGIFWIKEDSSSALNVGGVVSILLSWTIVPIIAGIIGFLLFGFIKFTLLRSQNAERRTLRAMPFYYGVTVVAIIFLIILKGAPRTSLNQMETFKLATITGPSGILAAVLAYTIIVPLAQKRLGCFQDGSQVGSDHSGMPKSKVDLMRDDKRGEQADQSSLRDIDMITAEELLRQFTELRILETVYEGDEEMGDQSPQITIKCSPIQTPSPARPVPAISFGQLLARTPNRLLSYRRLRRPPPKLTRKQQFLRSIKHLRAQTIEHKVEYGRETLVRHALAEKFDEKAEELFSFLQILTAMATAFLQGSIDIAGCMAPYAALRELYINKKSFEGIVGQQEEPTSNLIAMKEWMLVMGGSAAALGVALWGWKVARSLGGRLAFMSPARAFSAQLSLIVAIVVATKTKLPISITHTLVGAIVGVGTADNAKNVNWRLLLIFVGAWVFTLLASCALAAGLYSFTIFSPAYSVI